MDEHQKYVFIAALVIYGVESLRMAIDFVRSDMRYNTISFDQAFHDAEIFVTKAKSR